ncbi:hypothetical protein BJ165DRAFT_1534273 [Panaeolus papilionaceus]|nr:hypothetical protein BJ165DRAFT_1534273 [Panaeolus papilionaceus]
MTISIDSRTSMVDLQDYSAETETPPLTGMLPSSKPSQIRFSFHDTDAQRTVKVSSGSSSTGWTAVVESFIFEIAQPGDAPVSFSASSPHPEPHDNGSGSNVSGSSGIIPQPGSTRPSPSTSALNISGPIVSDSTGILDGIPGILTTGSITRNPLNGLPTSVLSVSPRLGASPRSSDNPNPSSMPTEPGTDLPSDPDPQHRHTIAIVISVICGTMAILAIVLGLLYMRRRRNLLNDTSEKRLPTGVMQGGDVDVTLIDDEAGDPDRVVRGVSEEGTSSSQNPFDNSYAENPRVFMDLDDASLISLARGDVIQHATRVSLISLRGSMRASIILTAPGVGYPPESNVTNSAATLSQTTHDDPSVEFSPTTPLIHSTMEMPSNSELPPEPTRLSVNSDSGIAPLQLDETRALRRASIPPPLSLSPPSLPTLATAPPHYWQLSPRAPFNDNSQQLAALSMSIPSQGSLNPSISHSQPVSLPS